VPLEISTFLLGGGWLSLSLLLLLLLLLLLALCLSFSCSPFYIIGVFPFPLFFPHSLPNPLSRLVSLLIAGGFLVKINFIPFWYMCRVSPFRPAPPVVGKGNKIFYTNHQL